MWESCQWLGVMRCFSPGTPVFHYLQLATHELATVWHKCDEKRNSKPKPTAKLSPTSRRKWISREISGRKIHVSHSCQAAAQDILFCSMKFHREASSRRIGCATIGNIWAEHWATQAYLSGWLARVSDMLTETRSALGGEKGYRPLYSTFNPCGINHL